MLISALTEHECRYATPRQRFLSSAIDAIIVGGLGSIGGAITSSLVMGQVQPLDLFANETTGPLIQQLFDMMAQLTGFTLIWWLYAALPLASSWQATPGKRLCRLKVVSTDFQPVNFAQASGRFAASQLTMSIFGLGYLPMFWSPKKQTLHDRMAGTVVIEAEPQLV